MRKPVHYSLTSSPTDVNEMLISIFCKPYWPPTSTQTGTQEGGRVGRKSAITSWRLENPVRTSDSLGVEKKCGRAHKMETEINHKGRLNSTIESGKTNWHWPLQVSGWSDDIQKDGPAGLKALLRRLKHLPNTITTDYWLQCDHRHTL